MIYALSSCNPFLVNSKEVSGKELLSITWNKTAGIFWYIFGFYICSIIWKTNESAGDKEKLQHSMLK